MTLLGALDNFYLTPAELEASPSRADGVSVGAEAELRHYCADLAAEAAVLLRVPQARARLGPLAGLAGVGRLLAWGRLPGAGSQRVSPPATARDQRALRLSPRLAACRQVVAATAQVLIQRFYCKRSLKKFDVKVGRSWVLARPGVGSWVLAAAVLPPPPPPSTQVPPPASCAPPGAACR